MGGWVAYLTGPKAVLRPIIPKPRAGIWRPVLPRALVGRDAGGAMVGGRGMEMRWIEMV